MNYIARQSSLILVLGIIVVCLLAHIRYELGKINKSIDQFKRKFGVK